MSLIKFFESTDAGAPTLNNAVGSMIAVLDACLITGYNTKAVTSITVSSGVATVVCTAHAYANTYGKDIRIAGATGIFTALNKDTNIANVTTNGFTFLCTGVADGVATGTITAKYAPLNWTKQYSGTNKAMYKRGDVTATGCMLRVDDNTAGVQARALLVENATDIDTYTNAAPVTAQIGDALGFFWSKGLGNSTAANWVVVADGLYFYLWVATTTGNTAGIMHGFGDIVDFKPVSVLGCAIAGPSGSGLNSSFAYYGSVQGPQNVIAGGKNGVAHSQQVSIESRSAGYGFSGALYPSDVDGGLVVSYPVLLKEGGSAEVHMRGLQPGLALPLASIAGTLATKTQISNIIGSSRVFLVLPAATNWSATVAYVPLIDLTGPWR